MSNDDDWQCFSISAMIGTSQRGAEDARAAARAIHCVIST
jgi:hypothetical protein